MGLCMKAAGCRIHMDMGYFTFAALRSDIASHIGWRGGNPYSESIWPSFAAWLKKKLSDGTVSPGTARFLTASDCSGRLMPSSCEGLAQDIRDMETGGMYGYIWSPDRSIGSFRELLRHCVSNGRCLTWG